MVICGVLGGNGDERVREIDFPLENDCCEGEGGYDKGWGFRVSWRWCAWVGGGVSESGDGEFLECASLITIVCANRARRRDV